VEGEKDVHTLESLNLLATTSGGATSWKDSFSRYFKDRNIIIIPDCDQAGQDYKNNVIESTKAVASSIKVIDLGLNDGGDITDYLETNTKEEFLEMIENAEVIPFKEKKPTPTAREQATTEIDNSTYNKYITKEDSPKEEGKPPKVENLQPWYFEQGNGRTSFLPKVLAKHLNKTKNSFSSCNRFYIYNNGHYQESEDGTIQRLINKHLRNNAKRNNIDETKFFWGMMNEIKSDEINTNKDILCLKNTNIQILSDGNIKLIPHTPKLLNTVQINANYDKNAKCPTFLKFLSEALPKNNIKAIQEVMGYLLAKDPRIKKAFFLLGKKDCGKSLILNVIENLLGESNCSNLQFQDLSDRFKLVGIVGKLVNVYADLENKDLLDSGIFKALTGGGKDRVSIEEKFKTGFSYRPFAKLLFSCNKMPLCPTDTDDSFIDRLFIIKLNEPLPQDKLDMELDKKLLKELDGIFNWALEGLKRVISNGWRIEEPPEVIEARKQYKGENNNVIQFIEECCIVTPEQKIFSKALYSEYKEYCMENGTKPLKNINFKKNILESSGVKYDEKLRIGNKVSTGYDGISTEVIKLFNNQ
jgi:putative DNA primase/helicase